MSALFHNLSSETLDCLAELIEQRLSDPNAALVPMTWREAAAREQADRELTHALRKAGQTRDKAANAYALAPLVSKRLH